MRPKRPTMPPEPVRTIRWEEPTEFGPITYAEGNPDWAHWAYVDMPRYRRAFALYRLASGRGKAPAWRQGPIGLGIERCPSDQFAESQPGWLEARRRIAQPAV